MKKHPLQKVEYDPVVDTLYVYISKSKVDHTIPLNDRVFFDVDKAGKIVGTEILDASEPFAPLAKKMQRALQKV
jgi:uncharacterized protein YuzE